MSERKPVALFDLDGTLAIYDGWVSETHIGPPVPRIYPDVPSPVERAQEYIRQGWEVRIFTARVAGLNPGVHDQRAVFDAIEAWCERYIGQKLPITCQKDYDVVVLFDDRAVGVEKNTGRLWGPLPT